MSERDPIAKETRDEAARWYARLNNTMISTETLKEFRAWKQIGDNLAAYMEIDAFWRRVSQLEKDPDIEAAAKDALERKGPKGPGGKGVLGILLIAGLGAAMALGYRAMSAVTYQTGVGEQRVVRLEDGSRLRLDTDSKLRVRLSDTERLIELEGGQAFFEVARDPRRPFVVRADKTEVRALGTKFDVRRRGEAVRVVLVEGKVEVHARSDEALASWVLAPGQQLQLSEGKGAAPANVDASAATSWTSGRLVFQNQTLQTAIDEVNRYSPTKIILLDASAGATKVSGSFETGDTEAFIATVSALHGLRIAARSHQEIRLEPAA
jgi:transmembrane sensor